MNDFRDKIGNVDFQQVTLDHAERYRQACLDAGNAPATVAKKIRHIKRFFQLAVNRRQREDNPFQNIDKPKVSKKKPRVFSQQEIDRIFKEAADLADTLNPGFNLKWNLLIWTALVTGMRRAELLNCTWSDIDFENGQLTVTAKADTPLTWLWMIKDSEERDVPLTEEILLELANHQATQPEGHPYVFVPPARYAYIQQLRRKGQWTLSDARLKVTTNFYPQFHRILKAAAVRKGKFHDFRRTAITNWFEEGLSEFEVMTLAGHSSFNTTHQFYLAVSGNLMDRARAASSKIVGSDLLQYCCSRPILKGTKKAVNRKSLTANHLNNGQGES